MNMRQNPPVDYCEWCGNPIPEGRMSRVYCSDDCVQEMYARYGDDYFWPGS